MLFRPRIAAAVPDDWFVKESITLLAPDGQANIIASGEPLDDDLTSERYAQVQGELLVAEFPGYKQLSFGPIELFEGRSGFVRKFELESCRRGACDSVPALLRRSGPRVHGDGN